MHKKFAIAAILCLIVALGIDFLSASSSKENSLSKLRFHLIELITSSCETVERADFQSAILNPAPSIDDLRIIEEYSNHFDQERISLRLNQRDSLIYWTNFDSDKRICLDTLLGSMSLECCLHIFDEVGRIHPDLYNDFGTFHEMAYDEQSSNVISLGGNEVALKIGSSTRSNFLVGLITILYLLFFILLLVSLAKDYTQVLLSLLVARLLFYILPLEEHLYPAGFFSGDHSFSILNESVAGFVFNSIIFFIASIAASKYISQSIAWFKEQQPYRLFGAISAGLILTVLFICNAKCLIYYAGLNFDFEDLSKLKILEQVSLACLGLNGLSLFIFNQSIYNQVSSLMPALHKKYAMYLGAAFVSSLLALLLQVEIPFFWIFSFLFALAIIFDLFSDLKSKNISWLIWWMIVFSLFIAAILFHFNMRKDMHNRMEFITDNYHLVDESLLGFYNDEFKSLTQEGYLIGILNKPLLSKFNTADIIEYIKSKKDALSDTNLELYTFDDYGNPLAIDHYESEESFKYRTRHRNYLDDKWSFDPLNNTYWVQEKIAVDKKIRSIYLGFSNDVNTNIEREFPISFFKEGSLVYDQNNLSIEEQMLVLEKAESKSIVYEGTSAYINYLPEENVIVSSKKIFASIIKPVALFSFIFAILGILLLLVSLLNGYFNFLPSGLPLKFWDINSFSIKIQLVIIALIIISFMGIAWVTVRFINDFINNNENQLIESKITSISKNLNLITREEINFEKALQIINGNKDELESIHQSNVSVYTDRGKEYFESTDGAEIDFLAHYYFNKLDSKYPFTLRQKEDEPKSYFLLNHQGTNRAIVSLGSNAEIRANKLSLFDFLGSIVNVYVFLFLIAGAISIAVARSISRPLSALGEKMKELKLGSLNERLEWNSDDEIGALIENYNGMLSQLENSAEVLAKTERDMAWREMAKQVAHEIKNPLTPMKLSIQYLEKAMKADPEDVKPLIKRISDTLLFQINNLSQIADSFSNFAQLPQANNIKVSLNEVVETIHDLFRKRDDIDIKLIEPIDSIYVYADKNHLVRILNNLVKNAIEAIPDTRDGKIGITLFKDDKNATIKVSDNGVGIPAHLHKKVFTPNFTTKNSGSGLGLAIASNMLDTFNARIYFETEENKGTDFFIEIPLIRLSNVKEDKSRIELE